ncbi:38497_t:CDS:1, partial [Gigaspora margarita]
NKVKHKVFEHYQKLVKQNYVYKTNNSKLEIVKVKTTKKSHTESQPILRLDIEKKILKF